MSKVLVTGGAGFIGSHVVEKLVAERCQVTVLDNLSTGSEKNLNSSAQFIKMDIKSPELEKLFMEQKYEYVIHLAAQTMVPVSIEKPDFDCAENIGGTVNVLEACRKSGVKRIVFASSAAVYGNATQLPIKETEVVQPTSFYGLSKLTAEKYIALYREIFGLQYVILRYANVFGERQGDSGEGGVISIFSRLVSRNEAVTIFGDGGQTRDFIYVGDVAAANYQALLTNNPDRVYNISTNSELAVNAMLEIMEATAGKSIVRNYTAPREGDIYRSALDNSDAVNNLNWHPGVSFRAGIERTYKALTC